MARATGPIGSQGAPSWGRLAPDLSVVKATRWFALSRCLNLYAIIAAPSHRRAARSKFETGTSDKTPVLAHHALSWLRIGSERMRRPVAAKIALVMAGATGGTPGSPTPPSGWL